MLAIRIGESLTCSFWEPKYFISVYDSDNNVEYAIGRFWTLTGAKKHQKEIKPLIKLINKERAIDQFKPKLISRHFDSYAINAEIRDKEGK